MLGIHPKPLALNPKLLIGSLGHRRSSKPQPPPPPPKKKKRKKTTTRKTLKNLLKNYTCPKLEKPRQRTMADAGVGRRKVVFSCLVPWASCHLGASPSSSAPEATRPTPGAAASSCFSPTSGTSDTSLASGKILGFALFGPNLASSSGPRRQDGASLREHLWR